MHGMLLAVYSCDVLKECIDELSPYIATIINNSLRTGTVPDIFKKAIVKPLLKKKGLNCEILKNYRPVSNLPFLSKILEKVILKQILGHMQENNLQECYQSAYRAHHSTETALMRIMNDLLHVMDSGKTTILGLLDLSAAFDTIDHNILLQRLNITFGISKTALKWISSYLSGRSQVVSIGNSTSTERGISYGVPQGSVLGPVLFVLYTSPVAKILEKHMLAYHMYADDTQIYSMCLQSDMQSKKQMYERCIVDIHSWMSANKLKLNGDKTEALFVGNAIYKERTQNMTMDIDGAAIPLSYRVKNLGVILDSNLSMESYIDQIRTCIIISFRNIRTIRPYISTEACKKLAWYQ